MHTRSPLVANGQPPKAVQPREGALDDPARAPEAAAVRGTPLGQRRLDAPAVQGVAMRLRIVGAVALHQIGFRARPADAAADGRDGVHQGQQLRDVVAVGGGQ